MRQCEAWPCAGDWTKLKTSSVPAGHAFVPPPRQPWHLCANTPVNNLSPHVRHAVISRIKHRNVDELDLGGFTDMWREWEGIADLTAAYA